MSSNSNLKNRLTKELREYAVVVAYLYVCFGIALFYRSAIASAEGVAYLHWGLVLGKALVLGKFLLIGNAAGVGKWGSARSILSLIMRRTVLLWILLIVLSFIEEIVLGMTHGLSVGAALAEFEAQSLLELFASSLMMLLILAPYVAVLELAAALGPGVLKQALFSVPGAGDDATPQG